MESPVPPGCAILIEIELSKSTLFERGLPLSRILDKVQKHPQIRQLILFNIGQLLQLLFHPQRIEDCSHELQRRSNHGHTFETEGINSMLSLGVDAGRAYSLNHGMFKVYRLLFRSSVGLRGR